LTDYDALWRKTRQGSATVAGVDYQVVVTASLLVGARRDAIRATGVRPEGIEDVDCLTIDGGTVLVQAKDRAGGDTTWTRAEMADAIAHAATGLRSLPDSRLVVITNARPGQGLVDSGWTRSLPDTLGHDDLEALRSAAQKRDAKIDDALLARCALHRRSRTELADHARATLAEDYVIAPAVAEIVFCVLLDDLQRLAAAQRQVAFSRARHRTPADLDALVHDVRSTVDLDALEKPLARGLVAPLDFSSPIDLELERFLLGVNVRPGHVAAGLDLLRADETASVFGAIQDGRGAILCGPSGAGKSALLWRCAYELAGTLRLIELRHVHDEEVEDLVRWLRAQRPTARAKVLVCADDLGRPELAAWSHFAMRVADLPGVLLLATCREEDLRPELLADDLALLRPVLDEKLAGEVAGQLVARGVTLKREPEEAFSDAQGLLLEYVALLATGERLRKVIGAQVHARIGAERTVEREALRYVSAAHLAGVGVPFDELQTLVGRPDELPEALARLSDEFLVHSDAGVWIGLHEVRSAAAHDALHDLPPPTQEQTAGRLLTALDPLNAAHFLRRVVDRGMRPAELLPGIQDAISNTEASGGAALLDAAIDVEALEHARLCWDATLAGFGAAGAASALTIAFVARFGGASDAATTTDLRRLALELPDPPATIAADAARTLSAADIADRVRTASSYDAAWLLEAVAVTGVLELTVDQARSVLAAHALAGTEEYARLVYAVWCLTPEARSDPSAALGPRNRRLDRLADADERILKWTADGHADGIKLVIEIFMLDGRIPGTVRRHVGRLALDLCPEAVGVCLRPRTPEGAMQKVPAQEEMDADRSALLSPRVDTRRNRAFLTALDRIRAAESWSERLYRQRDACEQLRDLVRDARIHLALRDDNARRRRGWVAAVQRLVEDIGRLPTPPLPRRPDEKGGPDDARKHLDRVGSALIAIAGAINGDDVNLGGVRAGLHDLSRELRRPATGPAALLVNMVADTLTTDIQLLERVLLVHSEQPGWKVHDREPGQAWVDAIDRAAAQAEDAIVASELAIVASALDGLDAEVHASGLPATSNGTTTFSDTSEDVPGSRYLAVVSEGDWEAAIWDRLDKLDEPDRMRIAFRVFVVPRRAGLALPTEAWQIGSERVYPADPERVAELARAAGIHFLQSEEADRYLLLLQAIVEASGAAALAAARAASRFSASRSIQAAQEAITRCRELNRSVAPEPAARAVAQLIDITERELAGESVMSQIVGHVLLHEHGDENHHSMLMSAVRSILVAIAADEAANTAAP